MDAIERSLRERLQRAAAEMSARPLRAEARFGSVQPPRRNLRPLLAAVALAVALGGVAGGFGLHSRPNARQVAPAVSPPAVLSTTAPMPSPTIEPAPFISGTGATAAWDSTHNRVVAYIGTYVFTWQGRWRQETPATAVAPDVPANQAILVDAPGLRGVALIGGGTTMGGGNWLWDGTVWTKLPDPASAYCMGPIRGVWDAHGNKLVVVFVDMCSGGSVRVPAQTWTFDGHTWQRRADLPVAEYAQWTIAWDPDAGAVVVIGASNGKARAWAWTGSAWTAGRVSAVDFSSDPVGAGWDARTRAVVVWARSPDGGTPSVLAYGNGTFRELPQTGKPEQTATVFADSTSGRLLALGQEAVPAAATPAPCCARTVYKDEYLLVWTGTTWVPLTAP